MKDGPDAGATLTPYESVSTMLAQAVKETSTRRYPRSESGTVKADAKTGGEDPSRAPTRKPEYEPEVGVGGLADR
jgi:hypothetical protein